MNPSGKTNHLSLSLKEYLRLNPSEQFPEEQKRTSQVNVISPEDAKKAQLEEIVKQKLSISAPLDNKDKKSFSKRQLVPSFLQKFLPDTDHEKKTSSSSTKSFQIKHKGKIAELPIPEKEMTDEIVLDRLDSVLRKSVKFSPIDVNEGSPPKMTMVDQFISPRNSTFMAKWDNLKKSWEKIQQNLQALESELLAVNGTLHSPRDKFCVKYYHIVQQFLELGTILFKLPIDFDADLIIQTLKKFEVLLSKIDKSSKGFKELMTKVFCGEAALKEWMEDESFIMKTLELQKFNKENSKKDAILKQKHLWLEKEIDPNDPKDETRILLTEVTTKVLERSFKCTDGRPLMKLITVQNGKETSKAETIFTSSDFNDKVPAPVLSTENHKNYYIQLFNKLKEKGYVGTAESSMSIKRQVKKLVVKKVPFEMDRVLKMGSFYSWFKGDEYFRGLYKGFCRDKFAIRFETLTEEQNVFLGNVGLECHIFIRGAQEFSVGQIRTFKIFRQIPTSDGETYVIEDGPICFVRVKWTIFDDVHGIPREIGMLQIHDIIFTAKATLEERDAVLDGFLKPHKEIELLQGYVPKGTQLKTRRIEWIMSQ